MKPSITTTAVVLPMLGVALMSTQMAHGAPAKSATKPATKAPAKRTSKQHKLIKEVLGTEPLVGYEGSLGETFTLGKNRPLNFTLNKVEYSASRVNIGDYAHIPLGDEKMMVLHFTVQNPQKKPLNYSASNLTFIAVDSGDLTRKAVQDVAREVTGKSLNLALNPGQKVEAYTAIKVAAYGEVPKLIVQNQYERETPIIRYDLRGKVGKLAAPFADPSDDKGATALKTIAGRIGVFYPVSDNQDARIDSISYTNEKLRGVVPGKGKRFCVALLTLKNKGPRVHNYSASYVRADLVDSDGETVTYNNSIRKASRDEEANGEYLPGEEVRVRYYWELPESATAKTVLLRYGYNRESRTFAIDVTGAPGTAQSGTEE